VRPHAYKEMTQRTVWVRECPIVQTRYNKEYIVPRKIVIEKREAGIRVVVHGPSSKVQHWRSTNFNIVGYKYPSPPVWLQKLMSDLGVSLKLDAN
jgi:hypothetical protein